MKPAQDKPYEPEKHTEREKKTRQFSLAEAEGKALSTDRRQHGQTVAKPKNSEQKNPGPHTP